MKRCIYCCILSVNNTRKVIKGEEWWNNKGVERRKHSSQWLRHFASLELAGLVVGKILILAVMHFHLPFKGMDRP